MLILSERHRLVYCEVPKCASTSMYRFFLNLNGIETDTIPRKYFIENEQALRELGLWTTNLTGEALREFIAERLEYYYFSVVRNPYSRVLSNYRNKLNRYAQKFDKPCYYRGKLDQLLSGPKAWGDANRAAECMGAYLSFDEFVRGLGEHGVDFDCHYQPQRDLLSSDIISYDRLIPIENLQQGIDDLFAAHRLDDSAAPSDSRPQHLNASKRRAASETGFTDETREIVYRLYRDDFEYLGYAA